MGSTVEVCGEVDMDCDKEKNIVVKILRRLNDNVFFLAEGRIRNRGMCLWIIHVFIVGVGLYVSYLFYNQKLWGERARGSWSATRGFCR